jgi:hypothetical protein
VTNCFCCRIKPFRLTPLHGVQPIGHEGYESSDSQGQALVDYYELDQANLAAIVMRIRAKYPKLSVRVDMGIVEYGYQEWEPSKISRPNRDLL